jgi:hypothetical protein
MSGQLTHQATNRNDEGNLWVVEQCLQAVRQVIAIVSEAVFDAAISYLGHVEAGFKSGFEISSRIRDGRENPDSRHDTSSSEAIE